LQSIIPIFLYPIVLAELGHHLPIGLGILGLLGLLRFLSLLGLLGLLGLLHSLGNGGFGRHKAGWRS